MAQPNITKIPLSGSTHGRGIKVVATAIGSGDTIHTALATTTDGEGDDIVIEAFNSNTTTTRRLTLGFGGTTDPDDLIEVDIAALSYVRIVPGLLLRNALVLKAAADVTNQVVIFGYVMRAQ